jgi:hypothetical protein
MNLKQIQLSFFSFRLDAKPRLGGPLRGWSTQIWTQIYNEVIFLRTFKTSYFLYLKSISGIFRVLTTLESTILENSLFCWQFDFEF